MLATIVTLALAAPTAVPDDKEKPLSEAGQKELKKLQGKWKAVKLVANGNEENNAEVAIQFKDRKVIVNQDGKELEFFDVAAIEPETTPKLLDFKAREDMAPFVKGNVYEAIYKLDGDELTIAIYIGEGKKRPEKFESPADSGIGVVTLKREK
jgi:uncharacterized protein (TIGR03067 family)